MTPPTFIDRLTRDYPGQNGRIAAAARLLASIQRNFFVEAAAIRPPEMNLAIAGIVRIYVERNLARTQVDLALRELFRVLGDPSSSWQSIGVSEDDRIELETGGASFEAVKAAVAGIILTYATGVLEEAASQMLTISDLVDPPPPEEEPEEEEPEEDPPT